MKTINLDLDKILKLHRNGISERQIAKQFNVSRSTIHNRINGLHYNSGNKKRFTVDEEFFDEINDLNSYWAGFIAADGNIFKNNLRIEIHTKDKNHLDKFRACIKFNGNIHDRKSRDTVSLGIISDNIVNSLKNNFNIVPCKSMILTPPKLLKETYIRNFVRGYIDGDGCYSNKYNLLSIRGTKNVLLWIKECFNKYANLNTKANVLYDYGSYKLQIRGVKKYTKIVAWLFKNSANLTVLSRKYNLVKHIVGEIINYNIEVKVKDYKKIEQNIVTDRQANMSKAEIAKRQQVSISHIINVLKKHNIDYYDKKRLTLDEVKQIRGMLQEYSYTTIANEFGVSKGTIYEISNNITWKN
jgi:transposase